ncbi:MAG: acyltransferase, partial [bacterium]|nr:acyltransferase [bacterium]
SALLAHLSPRTGIGTVLDIGRDANVRSNTVIYAGTTIGDGLETGHNVVIREENVIGSNFNIWNNSTVDYDCRIGNNVKIHCNCYVAQFSVLEDDVFLAPGVTIANDIHPGCPDSKPCMKGPTIKKGAKIGVNVTILPYVVIGERCLVGGGAVVTRDVPPDSVVFGNPARVHGSVHDLRCVTEIRDKGPYV